MEFIDNKLLIESKCRMEIEGAGITSDTILSYEKIINGLEDGAIGKEELTSKFLAIVFKSYRTNVISKVKMIANVNTILSTCGISYSFSLVNIFEKVKEAYTPNNAAALLDLKNIEASITSEFWKRELLRYILSKSLLSENISDISTYSEKLKTILENSPLPMRADRNTTILI